MLPSAIINLYDLTFSIYFLILLLRSLINCAFEISSFVQFKCLKGRADKVFLKCNIKMFLRG